jgi:hypothetical protein
MLLKKHWLFLVLVQGFRELSFLYQGKYVKEREAIRYRAGRDLRKRPQGAKG